MTSTRGQESGVGVAGAPLPEARTRPDWSPLREVGFVVLVVVGYLLVRWYTLDRTEEAIANARGVLGLEESLSLDWEHAVQSTTFTSVPWLWDERGSGPDGIRT